MNREEYIRFRSDLQRVGKNNYPILNVRVDLGDLDLSYDEGARLELEAPILGVLTEIFKMENESLVSLMLDNSGLNSGQKTRYCVDQQEEYDYDSYDTLPKDTEPSSSFLSIKPLAADIWRRNQQEIDVVITPYSNTASIDTINSRLLDQSDQAKSLAQSIIARQKTLKLEFIFAKRIQVIRDLLENKIEFPSVITSLVMQYLPNKKKRKRETE